MNDNANKPFNQGQLQAILTKWSEDKRAVSASASMDLPTTPKQAEQFTGLAAALDPQVIGNMRRTHSSLLTRMLAAYADYAPKAMTTLDNALAEASVEGLRNTAHSLKSSSANVGANRLSEFCRDLELSLKTTTEWDGDANSAAVDAIRQEFARVASEVANLQLELATPAASGSPHRPNGKASA